MRAERAGGSVDEEMPRSPGMHAVARLASVSHQTVSRVLNDHPHVRPATRERVREAIAELGYRRNAAARSLVTRRSSVVGLLTPRTDWYGPTSSMIAIEVAAREAGYFVSLASVSESSAESLRTAVGHFKDQAAEAVGHAYNHCPGCQRSEVDADDIHARVLRRHGSTPPPCGSASEFDRFDRTACPTRGSTTTVNVNNKPCQVFRICARIT